MDERSTLLTRLPTTATMTLLVVLLICSLVASFMPVVRPASTPFQLVVCTMVRNQARVLPEWLEFHVLQGVDLFVVYDNESTDNTASLLSAYGPLVRVVNWTQPTCSSGQLSDCQVLAFNDCLVNNRGRTQWLGLFDVDEFLFNIAGRLVDALDAHTSGYVFTGYLFGTNGFKTASEHRHLLVTESYVRRAPESGDPATPTPGVRKCIFRPEKVRHAEIHTFTRARWSSRPRRVFAGENGSLRVHH